MGSKLEVTDELSNSKAASRFCSNALRFLISGLWIASGLLHLQNIPAHFVAIANYRMLPIEASEILAFLLPCLHVIVGVALLLNEFRLPCFILSTGMAGIYLAAQVSVWLRGMRIDCGCFGSIWESTIGVSTIMRTSILFFICAWLAWLEAASIGIRRSFSGPRSVTRKAITLIELLVVIGVIGILIALVLPAVQSARESARRMSCMNNQRQLVLAAQLHESTFKRIPSTGWGYNWVGMSDQGTGKKQPGSWIYALLPYMEQSRLWSSSPTVQRPHSANEFQMYVRQKVATLNCPSKSIDDILNANISVNYRYAATTESTSRADYAINAGDTVLLNQSGPQSIGETGYVWISSGRPNGVAFARSEIRYSDIVDGTTNVFFCGEKWSEKPGTVDRGYDQPWSTGDSQESRRFTEKILLRDGSPNGDFERFGSSHQGGGVFGFIDCSVRFVPFSIHPSIYRTLGNRFDGNNGVIEVL